MDSKISTHGLIDIFYVIADEFEGSGYQSPCDSSLEGSGNEMSIFNEKH